MASDDRLYQIALTKLPGIGPVLAKNLVSYCGGVKQVFDQPKAKLEAIPQLGKTTIEKMRSKDVLKEAEAELRFVEEKGNQILFYTDAAFPWRLKNCVDSPVLLYYDGSADLNARYVLAVVGTRMATEYGKSITETMMKGLAPYKPLIISGLAYGIDIHAHRAALKFGLPTAAVVAHGLDRVYPYQHRHTAAEMLENGGLITEFPRDTNPDRENFPKRNRIVAGMADAVVIVESADKGGAIITASIAHSYNREVFAVPGRIRDQFSEGCNRLIRTLRAGCYTDPKSLAEDLNWQPVEEEKLNEIAHFTDLTADEQELVMLLKQHGTLGIDKIVTIAGKKPHTAASLLLELEFKGIIKSLPGSRYTLMPV